MTTPIYAVVTVRKPNPSSIRSEFAINGPFQKRQFAERLCMNHARNPSVTTCLVIQSGEVEDMINNIPTDLTTGQEIDLKVRLKAILKEYKQEEVAS